MRQSELFIMLAAAERDLVNMSHARPDISHQQRADPRLVEAIAGSRASLFTFLADHALQKEAFEDRLRAGQEIALSERWARPFRREDLFQVFPTPDDPEPEKPKAPWPTCRNCGEDLILAHVERGYCNAKCELEAQSKK